MGRSPCCSKEGLNRGAWTTKEDMILSEYIQIHGDKGWRNLPTKAGLKRCGKSCRLRWVNYLRPDIRRGSISPDEEELIIRMHRLLGNRWSLIAGRLPGRTDNEIKNYWNTYLSKKAIQQYQAGQRSQNVNTTPESPSPVQNHVFKTTPVKTTAVRYRGVLKPNGYNVVGNNGSSDQSLKFCDATQLSDSFGLLLNDSITSKDTECVGLKVEDINLVELIEVEKSNCSMWNLADQQVPCSQHFAQESATIAESLLDFNDMSSLQCNFISSPSNSLIDDFPLEQFYMGSPTSYATGTIEHEDVLNTACQL